MGRKFSFSLLKFSWLVSFTIFSFSNTSAEINAERHNTIKAHATDWLSKKPLAFTENQGQIADVNGNYAPYVLFKAEASQFNIWITTKGLTYEFFAGEAEEGEAEREKYESNIELETEMSQWRRVDMSLKGASIRRENIFKEQNLTQGAINYFAGHCPNGIFNVKSYGKIIIKEVYDGIDWVIYTSPSGGIKHDFIVHPHANPSQIKLAYEGDGTFAVSDDQIQFKNKLGCVTEGKLLCYQGSPENIVNTKYTFKRNSSPLLLGAGLSTAPNLQSLQDTSWFSYEIGFSVSSYNTNDSLIIDPQLTWGTYYGGNKADGAVDLQTDLSGNVYMLMYTNSNSGFPSKNLAGAYNDGLYNSGAGASWYNIFVIKFSNAGVLLWGTYYGSGESIPGKIAIDISGNLYVTGYTSDKTFPIQNLLGAYNDNVLAGGTKAFILKFASNGSRQWATYFGSPTTATSGFIQKGSAIVVSQVTGDIYLGGVTGGTGLPTLASGGAYIDATKSAGTDDAFVARFNNAGTLVWSTYFGGSSGDEITSIALDASDNLLVLGNTWSNAATFPIQNLAGAFNDNTLSGQDAFLAKFSSNNALLWSTYYGGALNEQAKSLGFDSGGNLYVTGNTQSNNIPIVNNPSLFAYNDNTLDGTWDLFVLRFDLSMNLNWSTYYGGSANDGIINAADNLAIDKCDNVYINFTSESYDINVVGDQACHFMNTSYIQNFYKPAFIMGGDPFVIKFNKTGILLWGSFTGNNCGNDWGQGIAIDNNNNLFLSGEWNSRDSIVPGGLGGAYSNPTTTWTPPGLPFIDAGGGAFIDSTFGGNDDSYLLKFIPIPLAVVPSQVNPMCGCNGSITVNACGYAPYVFVWSNGSTTGPTYTAMDTQSGLCAGAYSVTVYDASCNSKNLAFVLTPGVSSFSIAMSSSNAICGINNGSVTATPSGGNIPYTFLWNNGETTSAVSNLSAGVYSVTVTDASGCMSQGNIQIQSLSSTITATLTTSDVLCNGDSSGAATVNASGGNAPYLYLWNNGQTSSSITGLISDTYSIVITDNSGCTATANVIVNEPPVLSLTVTPSDLLCNKISTGQASGNIQGGVPPYNFLWNNGSTTATITNQPAGTFSLTVTDNNGCKLTQWCTINEPPPLALAMNSTPEHCSKNDGSATVNAMGGTGAYTYLWNPSLNNTASINNVSAGTFTATVTDENGCSQSAHIIVANMANDTLQIKSINHVSCQNKCDGEIVLQLSGNSNAPYSYFWNYDPNQKFLQINNLCQGLYSCTVTDATGCSSSIQVALTSPPVLSLTISPDTEICYGQNTIVNCNANGGTPGYTYLWSSGASTQTIVVSPTNTSDYTVTATDQNGCEATAITKVVVNPLPEINIIADQHNGCKPLCIQFNHTAVNSVSQQWNFGDSYSSGSFSPLHCYNQTGVFSVSLTVTDNNGCSNTHIQKNLITVFPDPIASFEINPNPTESNTVVNFIDKSIGATAWDWRFGETAGAFSSAQYPTYSYVDTGKYTVLQIVTNEFGCKDTAQQLLVVMPTFAFYIANTFTPNYDGKNETFFPMGIGIESGKYEFYIFDRWGALIFESLDPAIGWDGRVREQHPAQIDTYVWLIKLKDVNGLKHKYIGHVNLIK